VFGMIRRFYIASD